MAQVRGFHGSTAPAEARPVSDSDDDSRTPASGEPSSIIEIETSGTLAAHS